MDRDRALLDLARQVRNHLGYMAALGVENLPRVEVPRPTLPTPASPAETLEDIIKDLGGCRRCPLAEGRTNIVFGEGDPRAEMMFIGEGPGEDEDRQGRPFVGRAGRLLTDIIVKGMKMRREDCYIANVVKCRPPENRDPNPMEARACLPFLHRQIEAVRPKVICALGRVAARYLLDTNESLGRLRHRFHDLNGIPVMPTYHPASLLRHESWKRPTWEDVKLVMARLKED